MQSLFKKLLPARTLASRSVSVLMSIALLSACGSESSTSTTVYQPPVNTDQAVADIIDLLTLPAINDFAQQALALQTASSEFCNNRTTETLALAQQQWKNTAAAWYRYLPYNMGPSQIADDAVLIEVYAFIDALRFRGNNEASTVRNDIQRMLAGTVDSNFNNKNYNTLGLLALEISLFERISDGSTDSSNIVGAYTDKQCTILSGYNSAMVNRAQFIQQQWASDYQNSGHSYRDLLINGGLSALPLEDGAAADAKLITSSNEFMDYLHKRTLINDAAIVSGHTWALMNQAVTSLQNMIEGAPAASESFADLLQQYAPNDLATLRANVATAKATIEAENETDFYAAVLSLDGNIKRELKNGLGISVGLNFSDGD